jgi:hypothetical protein
MHRTTLQVSKAQLAAKKKPRSLRNTINHSMVADRLSNVRFTPKMLILTSDRQAAPTSPCTLSVGEQSSGGSIGPP